MAWGLSGLSLPLTMSSIKGPAPAPESFPRAEKLKIGIVHARWNKEVIDALVTGTLESLEKAGVKAARAICRGKTVGDSACKSVNATCLAPYSVIYKC